VITVASNADDNDVFAWLPLPAGMMIDGWRKMDLKTAPISVGSLKCWYIEKQNAVRFICVKACPKGTTASGQFSFSFPNGVTSPVSYNGRGAFFGNRSGEAIKDAYKAGGNTLTVSAACKWKEFSVKFVNDFRISTMVIDYFVSGRRRIDGDLVFSLSALSDNREDNGAIWTESCVVHGKLNIDPRLPIPVNALTEETELRCTGNTVMFFDGEESHSLLTISNGDGNPQHVEGLRAEYDPLLSCIVFSYKRTNGNRRSAEMPDLADHVIFHTFSLLCVPGADVVEPFAFGLHGSLWRPATLQQHLVHLRTG